MKKFSTFVMVAAVTMAIGSCGKKGGGEQQTVKEPESSEMVSINRDSTLYGICSDGSAMNTLQMITDVGDTVNISIAEANEKGQCFGGFQVGDRMAVIMKNKTTAQQVINQSALLGEWVMPNPIDGSSEMGIRIKDGGIAESIDQPSLIYRSWKLFNGKLEIVAVREGGGDMVETNLYDLISLGPDTLIFKDSEETFEFSRYHEHRSNVNIKLEESSIEDFKM